MVTSWVESLNQKLKQSLLDLRKDRAVNKDNKKFFLTKIDNKIRILKSGPTLKFIQILGGLFHTLQIIGQ